MQIDRRGFLKLSLSSTVALGMGGMSRYVFGQQGGNQETLVVVFLRGGCDALNFVAPVNDKNYIEARSSDLRIMDSGDHPGLPLQNGLSRELDFRIHNGAGPFVDLYKSGKLSIVHATGLTNGTRSHFESQDLIERGVASLDQVSHVNNGWLARYASFQGFGGAVPVVSASNGIDASLLGENRAVAVPDLQGGYQIPGGAESLKVLTRFYSVNGNPVSLAGISALNNISLIDSRLPRLPDGKYAAYVPDHGAVYDGGGDLARGLQSIARLIKMDVGLNVACVDHGGWDTHEGQPGRFNNQVGQLVRNIAAFYNDMSNYENKLTVVIMSEFGRRLRSNKSQGTDHGHGGMMFLLGGRIRGGQMYGQWPGLETEQLDRGVDLAVTTDYRTVLSEFLNLQHADAGQIFPDFDFSSKLGFRKT